LTNLEKIQTILCRHGIDWICTKEKVTLKIGTWPSDRAGGWNAVITNPTEFTAQIVDANMRISDKTIPLMFPVVAIDIAHANAVRSGVAFFGNVVNGPCSSRIGRIGLSVTDLPIAHINHFWLAVPIHIT
jgi:hypothetical protein